MRKEIQDHRSKECGPEEPDQSVGIKIIRPVKDQEHQEKQKR
jgi:hypothetical protein